MIHLILTIFIITIENTNQIKNEMKQKKRCKICHLNARNIVYLISHLAFCFERLKNVQNLVSSRQKLSYI